jgi:hypothetical protein
MLRLDTRACVLCAPLECDTLLAVWRTCSAKDSQTQDYNRHVV